MKKHLTKFAYLAASCLILTVLFVSVLTVRVLAFTTLQNRSIFIASSAGGANTSHVFSFNFPVVVTGVASIAFEYCDDPIDEIACVAPPGLDVSGAVLSAQSGETGFSINSASSNRIVI